MLATCLDDAHHRVVVARENGAVVAQHGIGYAGKFLARLGIIGDDRLVVQVARGHNEHGQRIGAALRLQRLREIVQQKVLHGRARQHDAQLGQLVGKAGGKMRFLTFAQQHDGALRRLQHALFRLVNVAHAARFVGAGHHNGERLAPAALALAQLRKRFGVRGIAYQMEPAKPLHRNDAAIKQHAHGRSEDGVGCFARVSPGDFLVCLPRYAPRDVRAAFPARIGLRVETAVERVGVFRGATRAHGEILHGRCGAIVGQRVDDGEARAAVRAVDERVAEAAVVGVEQLGQAVVARGKIGRHERGLLRRALVREANLERGEALQRHFVQVDFLDLRRAWGVHMQFGDELVQQVRLAFGVDEHTFRGVENPAVEQVFLRKAIHEGPKAHPLYDAFHLNVERLDHDQPLY